MQLVNMKNLNPCSSVLSFRNDPVTNGLPVHSGRVFFMEEWKDVPNFKGIYQVSNYGRLRSFKKNPNGKILSNINKDGGYFSVVLRYQKQVRYCRMHVLVAEAFIPNWDNKPEVNHKDTNKQNNLHSNLEWCTRKENHIHAIKHIPAVLAGMNNYNRFIRPIPILQFDLLGNFISEYPNGTIAHEATKVCQRNILQVAHKTEYKSGRIRKQAGGFIWRLKTDSI